MSCTNSILYSKDKTESVQLADIVASQQPQFLEAWPEWNYTFMSTVTGWLSYLSNELQYNSKISNLKESKWINFEHIYKSDLYI